MNKDVVVVRRADQMSRFCLTFPVVFLKFFDLLQCLHVCNIYLKGIYASILEH